MTIEHLKAGQVLPVLLGFGRYDPSWVWVVRDDNGRMAAALIASPAHDAVVLLTIQRWGELRPNWIHVLMTRVGEECLTRGFDRFITWLAMDRDEERAIARAMKRHGAQLERFDGECVAGPIRKVA